MLDYFKRNMYTTQKWLKQTQLSHRVRGCVYPVFSFPAYTCLIFLCAIFVLCHTSLFISVAQAQPTSTIKATQQTINPHQEHKKILDAYASLTDTIYTQLATSKNQEKKYKTIKSLRTDISHHINDKNDNKALTLIYRNFSLITDDIYDESVPFFYSILISHYLYPKANQLKELAKEQGNFELLDIIYFHEAKHFANEQDWHKTIESLSNIENKTALTLDQQEYSTLLFGVALQHTKKHREALLIFDKIDKKSSYYKHAQLNKAIAYIRQDWWTDAQLAIKQAHNTHTTKNTIDEFANRLHLVLGYSQLKNEFYRDARKTFRKVNISSQYTTRALIGIGLSALSQNDHPGALNAFTRIKANKENNLAQYESYLLTAYTYFQAGNIPLARINYNEAILFYHNLIATLNANPTIMNKIFDKKVSDRLSSIKTIEKTLMTLSTKNISKALKAQSKKILENSQTLHNDIYNRQKNLIVNHINSYISQCEFGLATLYDKS